VFSWDKPGVGASTGNWLHQSMSDRADETLSAINALWQVPGDGQRPVAAQIRFVLSGRNAYEGKVLDSVTDWIVEVSTAS